MKKIFLFFCCVCFMQNIVFANSQSYSELTSGISQAALFKPYKYALKRPLILNKIKKQTYALSEIDRTVIKKYVVGAVKGEDTFSLMNANLNYNLGRYLSQKDITNPLKARLNMYADDLSKTLSKTALPQNILLYYGVDDKELLGLFPGKNLEQYLLQPVSDDNLRSLKSTMSGSEFTESAFMKATYDKNFAAPTKFRFEIKAPKMLRAVVIESITQNGRKEVLINKGYKWKIVDITKAYDSNNKSYYYQFTIKLLLH